MRRLCKFRCNWFIAVSALLSLCLAAGVAAAQQQSDAEKTLIEKAQALESRGRPDIAVQVWQQILLSDPNNPMALEGVARDYRLSGNSAASDEALDKLRRINPNDTNIGKIQGLTSNKTRDVRLGQAGALAKAGNSDAAMKIYREYYGDHPPDGDMALAYYETLYSTASGKAEALNGVRALAARNPGDERFIVTLGRMLTYDAKTRTEGIKILREHPDNSDAQNSLRQALVWDSDNPASAAELKTYLQAHPKDTELATRLQANEKKLAQMNAGIARTPAELAAFGALNAHHLEDAEARFMAMLDENPKDARAAAGMGFVRMQQNNFGGAISYLVQAEDNGFRDSSVVGGLATSRFWFTMGEASSAFDANQFDEAAEKYQEALGMRPRSPEALNGLAGVYVKNEQYPAAAEVYQRILKIQPASADAWRGLFLAYARNNQGPQSLTIMGRFPASVKATLSRDPDYLSTVANIYHNSGRDAEAQKILAQALALPFPDNGATLKEGTRIEYAGILMTAQRYDQAAELYKQVLSDDTNSLPAWMGLVTAEHQLEQDRAAIELVEKMPPATYETALADPGFLNMLGSIYAQANQFEVAQGLLERAAKVQTQAGGQPSLPLQIQLAAIYLQRNLTEQAYALYQQILLAHPENLDAWRGLIGSLQSTNRDAEALSEIKMIPPDVRKQLEADVQFEQSEASLYAASGDTVNALSLFNRVQRHYADLQQSPPADVDIQSAYLLYNTKNDRGLYPVLMRLGARQDLTNAQRETVQGLWANWSVRRSATAFAAGNTQRALDILDAAAQAFPDNLAVRKAVAGGYLTAGKSREALAIFKQIDMQDASAADFQGAIGSALAANDKTQAETWLRQALDRYPRDSAILSMAARFEQARGDNGRAADYWRASLAAMPTVSPTEKLAHELVNPEPEKANDRSATPDDLAALLNPESEPAPKTQKAAPLPPLPSYGPDPYMGSAPVILTPRVSSQGNRAAVGRAPVYPVPTSTTAPLPASELIPSAPVQTALPSAPSGYPGNAASSVQVPAYSSSTVTHTVRRTTPRATTATTARTTASGQVAKTSRSVSSKKPSAAAYSGQMHLPAGEENIQTTQPAASGTSQRLQTGTPATAPYTQPAAPATLPVYPQNYQNYPQVVPQSYSEPVGQHSQPALRAQVITPKANEPMSLTAARAQAMLIDETDGQITQGFTIRYLSNATSVADVNGPVRVPSSRTAPLLPTNSSAADRGYPHQNPAGIAAQETISAVQYTPSAQDAAAGAYSAQKPVTPPPPPLEQQPVAPQQVQQPAAPAQAQQVPPLTTRRGRRRARTQSNGNSVPTLVTAPGQNSIPEQPVTDSPLPAGQTGTNTGLTDQELQERNLPPLRGPWVRTARQAPVVLSPRDEAEMQLRQIEGGYSPWLGGTGTVAHRTGNAGFDGLNSLTASFEASVPLGTGARFTVIATPVFLDSGQANGNAVITLSSGVGPEPFGTESGTTASTTPPPQQNATGIAGEGQLTFGNLSLAFGTTPRGFLVSNYTGRATWRPDAGPFTFSFVRDSVKDTQLSYAGLRDPGSATAFFPGSIWGGVISNAGNVQFAKGDLISGYYIGVGGQSITGYHVLSNSRFDGSMGAYWRVWVKPEYGSLNIGANFFGMHYSHNIQAFTYGQGGYFSPQAYFLANVPLTWTGHYMTRWHYTILGSVGIQAFQQDSEPLYPLDPSIEIGQNNPSLPATTSIGPNYDIRGQMAYAISDHWFVGAFAGGNNSRNYTNLTAGFSVRYLFRSQPSTVAGPTGLFQTDDAHDLRPLTIP